MENRTVRFTNWVKRNSLLLFGALILTLATTAILSDAYKDHVRKNSSRNVISEKSILICEPTNFAFYPEKATILALFNEKDVPGAYISCRTGECCLEVLKNSFGTKISREIDSVIDTAANNGDALYFRIGEQPNRTIAIYTR